MKCGPDSAPNTADSMTQSSDPEVQAIGHAMLKGNFQPIECYSLTAHSSGDVTKALPAPTIETAVDAAVVRAQRYAEGMRRLS